MIPTNTDVSIKVEKTIPARAEAVAVFVTERAKDAGAAQRLLAPAEWQAVARLLGAGAARGKAREVAIDLVDSGRGKSRRVLVAGLGKSEKLTAEQVRQASGAVARATRGNRLRRIAMVVTAAGNLSADDVAAAVVSGFLLAAFDYQEYKGVVSRKKQADEERGDKRIELSIVVAASEVQKVRAATERARIIADGQNFARTIASRPGNNINPPKLARVAQELSRQVGLSCRVLDEKQMDRLGMGGILAVGAGSSATPPRMIVMEHVGAKPASPGRRARKRATQTSPLLVVGKAITFDTGGISIKPADKMGRMIFDKSGGMAVLGLMYAVAKLKLPVHVVGILSSAENHISETAYRPGDILKMYNGVTVEVTNTDAEGRLVLGDALAWGIETFKPAAVIDLATLTGGVVVALGRTMAGMMSNDDALVREIEQSAESAGEKVWRLPLGDEQREQIRSEPADIVNSAGRDGSPLQGAAFLSHFVPQDNSVPWAHLDIAGVADTERELPYYAKGSTGWGVRTLVEFVSRRSGK